MTLSYSDKLMFFIQKWLPWLIRLFVSFSVSNGGCSVWLEVYKLFIHSICPIELEINKIEKPKNLIRQDSHPCKVSKYTYDKFENRHVTNLKIPYFNSTYPKNPGLISGILFSRYFEFPSISIDICSLLRGVKMSTAIIAVACCGISLISPWIS